ncbi:lysosomal cobalamin transporter ABCD4-like isoform X2 [Oscarella lobularis]
MSAALAQCLVKFMSGWMYVTWRKQVTMRLHKDYFADITYYDINALEKKTVDNPDQRIAQDVDRFCNNFCNQLAAQVIVTPFVVAYYTYKCWKSVGYYGPALVYTYFGFGAVINRLIMTPIVRLVFGQEKLEGNFRFQHVQFRNHAETVAFYRSGKTEQTRIGHIFKKLLGVQWRLVKWNLALNWAIGLFAYLGSILSYLIVALGVFATQRFVSMSASEISVTLSENSFLVLYLISSFSTLISLSGTISDVAGFTHRVGQLLESINSASEKKKKASEDKYTKLSSDTEAFRLVGVSYGPRGNQRILVNDLSLSIEEKRNILITGKTGCGKSSLFRVINGLWNPFRGEVERLISRSPENYLVLPQRPFFVCGNLRAQVTYPLSMEDSSVDERIHRALSMACVDYLVERVGGLDHDYEPLTEDFVSVGEMQKLGFARLFFFMPKFAFLDEATSAMDEESEERLYRTCCDHKITLISISHRSSIRKFHHAELHLSGNGQWRLDEIESHSNDQSEL